MDEANKEEKKEVLKEQKEEQVFLPPEDFNVSEWLANIQQVFGGQDLYLLAKLSLKEEGKKANKKTHRIIEIVAAASEKQDLGYMFDKVSPSYVG